MNSNNFLKITILIIVMLFSGLNIKITNTKQNSYIKDLESLKFSTYINNVYASCERAAVGDCGGVIDTCPWTVAFCFGCCNVEIDRCGFCRFACRCNIGFGRARFVYGECYGPSK